MKFYILGHFQTNHRRQAGVAGARFSLLFRFFRTCTVVLLFILGPAITAQAASPQRTSIRVPLPGEVTSMAFAQTAGTTATFPVASLSGNPGQPGVPRHTVRILLPADAIPKSVSVTLEGVTVETLSGSWDVEPVPPLAISAKRGEAIWPRGRRIAAGRDVDAYLTDGFTPASFLGRTHSGRLRRYRIAEVDIHPYRYNPVTKTLQRLSGGEIVVSYRTQPATRQAGGRARRSRGDVAARKMLRKSVMNFSEFAASYDEGDSFVPESSFSLDEDASTGEGDPAAGGSSGYVIITTAAIQSGSGQLANFVTAKEAQGFTVFVVTEGTWGGGTGNTAANRIRSWLAANYESMGLDYALLIGDPDPTSGDVPMKMCYPQTYDPGNERCPTDYFYAELTGDWDLDNDGRYGEYYGDYGPGGAERICEIVVGRIPCYGNMTDLDSILTKTIEYGNTMVSDAAWRKKVLLPMEPSDGSTPGYHLGEAIRTAIVAPKGGWSYHRVYDSKYSLNPIPETVPCTVANVQNAWLASDIGATFWWTHGSSSSAADVMDLSAAATLDNAHPSFTFQCSCNNAYPESANNLAYSLLKNGAIGTISGTRVTWYWVGQTSFAGTTSNSGMTYEYAQRLIGNQMPAGDALQGLKYDLAPSHQTGWMNYLGFNLYGSPEIGLFTYVDIEPPSDLTALAVSGNEVSLAWTDNATNETGFAVERYEGETAAEVPDDSGQGNDGTMNPSVTSGPQWVNEGAGGSIQFDGDEDYIDAGDIGAIEAIDELTISVWVMPDVNDADRAIVSKGNVALNTVWVLWQDQAASVSGRSRTVSFGVSNGSTLSRVEGATDALPAGQWSHVVATWTRSPESIRLYINGALNQQDTDLRGVSMNNSSDPVRFGAMASGLALYDGRMTGMRIYSRAVGTSEAASLYAAGRFASADAIGTEGLQLLYRCESAPPVWSDITQLAADLESYSDTTVVGDTRYHYRVKAFNDMGDSPYCASATVNTPLQTGSAPTVALTTPTDGAIFVAPADITVAADASDADGSVTAVDFRANGTSFGDDTTAPYGMTWSGVAPGTYALTAVATDNDLNATTSVTVNVSVQSGANTPAAPSGLDGQAVSGSQVDLSWTDNAANETGFYIERGGGQTPGAVTDLSGNGRDGTLEPGASTGPGWVADGDDGYYDFDGVDDVISADDIGAVEAVNELTLCAWIRPDANDTDRVILSKGNIALNTVWILWQDETASLTGRRRTVSFGVSSGSALSRTEGSTDVLPVGQWTHVVAVWQRSPEAIKLYVNGVLDRENTDRRGVTMNSSDDPVLIGSSASGSGPFDGNLTGVRMYSRALSASEISTLYAADRSATADAVATTGLEIMYTGNPSWQQIAELGENIMTYSDTGVTGNREYRYRAQAYNGDGESEYSNLVTVETPTQLPLAPSGLSAQALSANHVDLAWTDNADNETGFRIERGGGHAAAVVVDNSGNDRNGALTPDATDGPQWAADGDGGYYDFDGGDDCIDGGDIAAVEGVDEITISAWIRPDVNNADQVILSKGNIAMNTVWVLWQDETASLTGRRRTVSFGVSNGSSLSRVEGLTDAVPVGEWTHVVAVWRRSPETIRLYINGALNQQDTDRRGVTMKTSPDAVTVGSGVSGSCAYNGRMTGTRIYGRVLSTTEISTLFAAGRAAAADAIDTTSLELCYSGMPLWQQIAQIGENIESYSDTTVGANNIYHYRSRAYNGYGDSAYSNVDTVETPSLPGNAPTVSISSPSDGATFTEGTDITITASASDSDGAVVNVEFYEGAVKLGEDTSSPYSYTWTGATVGSHSLTAKATDNDTYTTVSDPVSITVQAGGSGPVAPSGLTGQAISGSEVDLTWTDNADSETGFRVERGWGLEPGTVADGSGMERDGALGPDAVNGPQWNATGDGGYYEFDGSDDYVSGGDIAAVEGLDEITVSAWVRPDASDADCVLLSKGGIALNTVWVLWQDETASLTGRRRTISFGVSSGGALSRVEGSTDVLPEGQWTHVVAVWRRSPETIKLYVNGSLDQQDTNRRGVTMNRTDDPVTVGAAADGVCAFDGGITGVRVYSRMLSSTEISTLSAAGSTAGVDTISVSGIELFYAGDPSWQQIVELGADAGSYSDSGLTSSRMYCYRVRAYNDDGDSDYSNVATVEMPTQLPSAPSGLSAQAVSDNQVDLTWTDNASNESGFRIERGGGQSTGSVEDDSGNGRNGTLWPSAAAGPQWADDGDDGYYQFDGLNDYIDSGDIASVEGVDEITVSVWIRPDANDADRVLLSKGSIALNTVWVLWQDETASLTGRRRTVAFGVSNGSALSRVEGSSNVVPEGQWTHVVAVWRRSPETIKLYINGVLDQEDTSTRGVSMKSSTDPVRIGTTCSCGAFYDGAMTGVRIYSRMLGASEISTLYTAGRSGAVDVIDPSSQQLFYSADPSWQQISTVGADLETYSDQGVAGDNVYYYRLRAYNGYGDSGYSNVDSVETPAAGASQPAATMISLSDEATFPEEGDAGGSVALAPDDGDAANMAFRRPSATKTGKGSFVSYGSVAGRLSRTTALYPLHVMTSNGALPGDDGYAAVDGNMDTMWTGLAEAGGWWIVFAYDGQPRVFSVDILSDVPRSDVLLLGSTNAAAWYDVHSCLRARGYVALKYLWLIFPDSEAGRPPEIREIHVLGSP